jgi:DNA-binding NarL/FixJ family response regulator
MSTILQPSSARYRILLVDDHKIMRDGIKAILSPSPEFQIAGEAANGPDAVQFAKSFHPDIVLMDIGITGLNGVEATKEILRFHPDCRVVILSMYDDENTVLGALRAGARGFILKKASDLDLASALHIVATGGIYVSPQVSDNLMLRIQNGNLEMQESHSALAALTPRELQVLRLVAEGNSSKEVATALALTEQTVRSYRKAIMRKLGVNTAVALTQLAYTCGLTRLSRPGHRAESRQSAFKFASSGRASIE